VLAAFALLTSQRLPDWKTQDNLDRSALRVSPNSGRANFYYGLYLWNHMYQTLPKNATPSRRIAVLDSVRPFFEKAVQIVPSYDYANSFKAGLAVEYYKQDHDYGKLVKAFEDVNRTGTYEPLIVAYLNELNNSVSNVADARMLAAFYSRMIEFYKANYPTTTLPADYTSLLKGINVRISTLQ
jgi:hypothetical protein